MPDESCRSCGGDLRVHSQCEGCRKAIQKICLNFSSVTRRQFHDRCKQNVLVGSQGAMCILEQAPKAGQGKALPKLHARPLAVALAVIGIMMAGFVAGAYPEMLQGQQAGHVDLNPDMPVPQARHASAVREDLQNCLAYGSGESVTVTCPTQYGYVYKAILGMPQDLAAKFSDTVFSIRGVSVSEISDGTVILEYENAIYRTGFFAS